MKIYSMLFAAIVVGLAGTSAQAADSKLRIVKSLPLGSKAQVESVPGVNAVTPFYSDITTFSGSAFAFGGTQGAARWRNRVADGVVLRRSLARSGCAEWLVYAERSDVLGSQSEFGRLGRRAHGSFLRPGYGSAHRWRRAFPRP